MWGKLVATLEGLKSPYLLAWAVISPTITLLSPDEWIKEAVFFAILLFVLFYWLAKRQEKYRELGSDIGTGKLIKECDRAIRRAVKYLETASNQYEHKTRLRVTKSVMESATVLGAEIIGKRHLEEDTTYDVRGSAWIFEVLKSQFSGVTIPQKLEGFDCSSCRGRNDCNVTFFDYLSHFIYCQGTPAFVTFYEQFAFLGALLPDRLLEGDKNFLGWPVRTSGSEIDSFATATCLHICLMFESLSPKQLTEIVKWLLSSQDEAGNWTRSEQSANECGGHLDVITTHRVIESLRLAQAKITTESLKNGIESSIQLGARFLAGAALVDDPVSYERDSGILSPEVYRVIGHIVQGLTKAGCSDMQSVREKIILILKSQDSDGSFRTSGTLLENDRTLLHYTDITAFMIRTLVFYVRAVRG
jgi:hypothetical protein